MNLTSTDRQYLQARALLQANPTLGKKKIAEALGVHPPMGRIFKQRFLGETEGHATDAQYRAVKTLKEKHSDWSAAKVAEALDLSVDKARVHLARFQGAASPLPQNLAVDSPDAPPTQGEPNEVDEPASGAELKVSGTEEERSLSSRSPRIRSVEDLLVATETDTRHWMVERHLINKWQIGARDPVSGTILTEDLYQVKVWLRRKVAENALREVSAELLKAFVEQAPLRPAIVRRQPGDGMFEIALFDLHFGKLAWGEECGCDYNPEIATTLFWNALEDLLEKGAALRPAKILFPIGNDFLHTDILGRTTTAGTPQDSAITWKDAFVRGWQLLHQGIEQLRKVAPVYVPVVNGNHDAMGAYHLGEVIRAAFSRTSDVTVDNSAAQRKYVSYHKCLLGLTHGSEEKHAQLGLLMASERPTEWAKSTPSAREFHIGHLHHKRSMKLLPAADVGGVLVRVIPSLTGLDSWHASKGYFSQRAAEAFYWDPECGVTASFTHSPEQN